ncbi:MAG: SIS domain-containing protein [Clostridia bacterium]|nr:SIS domain-containing protein [Clostridia bacterium]
MTALYALNIDPLRETGETRERVLTHLDKMSAKHPHLSCVKDSLLEAYIAIRDAFENGGKLLICGNGGSCADAEHIVGELMKGFYLKRPIKSAKEGSVLKKLQGALPAIALTGHAALSTAFNNDEDPAYTYAQQTYGYGRKGDVLIGISTSGNAKNVSNAVLCAKEIGMTAIALTGGTGGRLKELCDVSVIAPGNCPADVQECHLPIYHTLCAMLESAFFDE